MFKLFLTPDWFNGWDVIFEAIGLIIAFLITAYSWKIYRLSKEDKFKYFSLAFLLISFGFIFELITQGVSYFGPVKELADTILSPITQGSVSYGNLFYRAGFFLEMVSMLGGWLLIFFVSQKPRNRLKKYYEVSQIGLFIYLITLISMISNFKYFIYNLTSLVILGLIVLNYYKNYLNTDGNKNAFLVMTSFFLIFISQLFFVFVFIWENFYVFGEVFLLFGFLTLLYTYRKTTKGNY